MIPVQAQIFWAWTVIGITCRNIGQLKFDTRGRISKFFDSFMLSYDINIVFQHTIAYLINLINFNLIQQIKAVLRLLNKTIVLTLGITSTGTRNDWIESAINFILFLLHECLHLDANAFPNLQCLDSSPFQLHRHARSRSDTVRHNWTGLSLDGKLDRWITKLFQGRHKMEQLK